MEALGHIGVALLVYIPVAYLLFVAAERRRLVAGLGALCAVALLPDIDIHVAGLAHRGITHTLWMALATGGLLAVVSWLFRPRPAVLDWVVAGSVGLLGVVSHLLADVLTPMGVRPFDPLGSTMYTLDVVPATDPTANAVLFVAGAVGFAAAIHLGHRRSGREGSAGSVSSRVRPGDRVRSSRSAPLGRETDADR